MVVDYFVEKMGNQELIIFFKGFYYFFIYVIGVGICGECFECIGDKCWLYFFEDNCFFYCVIIFFNYFLYNQFQVDVKLFIFYKVDGSKVDLSEVKFGLYWFIMLEVFQFIMKLVDEENIFRDCIQGFINMEMIKFEDEIIFIYYCKFDYGYFILLFECEGVFKEFFFKFQVQGIWFCGCFGSWRYEVGNQDYFFMFGVEVVDNIVSGVVELIFNYFDFVNFCVNMEWRFDQFFYSVGIFFKEFFFREWV